MTEKITAIKERLEVKYEVYFTKEKKIRLYNPATETTIVLENWEAAREFAELDISDEDIADYLVMQSDLADYEDELRAALEE